MEYKKKDGFYECEAQPSKTYIEKPNITWHYLCLLLFMPWASIVPHMSMQGQLLSQHVYIYAWGSYISPVL